MPSHEGRGPFRPAARPGRGKFPCAGMSMALAPPQSATACAWPPRPAPASADRRWRLALREKFSRPCSLLRPGARGRVHSPGEIADRRAGPQAVGGDGWSRWPFPQWLEAHQLRLAHAFRARCCRVREGAVFAIVGGRDRGCRSSPWSAGRARPAPSPRAMLAQVRFKSFGSCASYLPEIVDPVRPPRLHDIVIDGTDLRRGILDLDQRDDA